MKIKLSILDRLQINTVLPKTGQVIEMEIAKSILNAVKLTSKEIEDWKIKDHPDGSISWDAKKAKEVEFIFTPAELSIMKKGAVLLDSGGSVTFQNLDLVKKVTEAKELEGEAVPVKPRKLK